MLAGHRGIEQVVNNEENRKKIFSKGCKGFSIAGLELASSLSLSRSVQHLSTAPESFELRRLVTIACVLPQKAGDPSSGSCIHGASEVSQHGGLSWSYTEM